MDLDSAENACYMWNAANAPYNSALGSTSTELASLVAVRSNKRLIAPFSCGNRSFAKTGSGQAYKHAARFNNRSAFLRRRFAAALRSTSSTSSSPLRRCSARRRTVQAHVHGGKPRRRCCQTRPSHGGSAWW